MKATSISESTSPTLIPQIQWGLESLWLAMVILVPVSFMSGNEVFPPPYVHYIDVFKVGLFRLLTGIMVIFWLIEWCLQGRIPFIPLLNAKGTVGTRLNSGISVPTGWLREQPVRWVILAVVFFLGMHCSAPPCPHHSV